jgi:hypothetical protein
MKLDIHNPGVTGILAPPLSQDEIDYLNATVLGPGGVSNPDNMHDENPSTRAAITNAGFNSFTLDLGSIATRPLKANVGQFRSPPSNTVTWFLEYSDNNSTWTQGDTINNSGTGLHTMDAGSVSFRYCRCRSVPDVSTWNMQAAMGTTNS